MTEHPDDTGHPDDTALSAALDGEDELAAGHARSCAACAGRLAQLASVAAAVGGAVPPPSQAARLAAIEAALGATAADATAALSPEIPRRKARRRTLAVLSAAAVVALVVLAVAAIGRTSATRSPAASRTAAVPTQPVVNGGDLGAVSGGNQLAALVAGRLGVPGPAAGGGAAGVSGAPQSARAPAAFAASATSPVPAGAQCVAQADAAGAARLGTLDLHATVRWQDQPAEVLSFSAPPGAGLRHHLFVMALAGCGLLAVQSF